MYSLSPNLIALVMTIASAQALAQTPERVSGEWFANSGKFGLVSQAGDSHPHFLYGECDRSKRRATVQLEIDPKLFADVLTTEKYLFVHVNNGQIQKPLAVTKISMSEAGKYGWLPEIDVDLQSLEGWSQGQHLTLAIAIGNYRETETRKEFLLPNENRQVALASFIRDCFGDQPSRRL
jgi:hypothetical protein